MIYSYLTALLTDLEVRVPPPPNCHHSITVYAPGELALWVNDGQRMWPAMLNADELKRPAAELAADIATEIAKAKGGE